MLLFAHIIPCLAPSLLPSRPTRILLYTKLAPTHNAKAVNMHAPEVTEQIKRVGNKMDEVSDDIDQVNKIKYDDASVFDAEKDKAAFRQYETACDRVKNFYAVSDSSTSTSIWVIHE